MTQVTDEADLLRWAVGALPYRNTLSDTARAELDATVLARAEAIGANPDLLATLSGSRVQGASASATQGGSHEAQTNA